MIADNSGVEMDEFWDRRDNTANSAGVLCRLMLAATSTADNVRTVVTVITAVNADLVVTGRIRASGNDEQHNPCSADDARDEVIENCQGPDWISPRGTPSILVFRNP